MLASRFPSPMAHLLRQSARPTPFRPAQYRSLCNATPTRTSSSQSFLRSYRLAVAASLPAAALTLSALDNRQPLQCASDRSYAQLSDAADTTGAAPPPSEADSIINLRDLSFGTVSGICVGIFVKKGLKVRYRRLSLLLPSSTDVSDAVQAAAFIFGGVFVLMQVRPLSLLPLSFPPPCGAHFKPLNLLISSPIPAFHSVAPSLTRPTLAQYLSSRSLITINWSALTSSYDKLITKRAGPPASQGGNRLGGLWTWFIDFVGANVQSRATFVAGVMLGLRIG